MRPLVRFLLLLIFAVPVAVLVGVSVGLSGAAWAGPPDVVRVKPPRLAQVADPAALCETAIASAEYAARLPPHLLGAIGITETGRLDTASGRLRPWPWTINAAGEGMFFQNRQQAITAVRALQARGVRSIDVGCLQVNLMYHPAAFATLDDAFDPRTNASYAAQFLTALYAGRRDWAQAVAAYHSETPALGDAYRMLVMARWHNRDARVLVPVSGSYRDFIPQQTAYAAFAPASRVYGAFAAPAERR